MRVSCSCIENTSTILGIFKLGFQRRNMDVALLDETFDDVQMLVSILSIFFDDFVKVKN